METQDLITINATVIAGLLIFFTLQSLGAPAFSSIVEQNLIKIIQSKGEQMTLAQLCDPREKGGVLHYAREGEVKYLQDKYCDKFNGTMADLTFEMTAANNAISRISPNSYSRDFVNLYLTGVLYVHIINIVMIIPFTASSIIELNHLRKGEKNVSNKSLVITIGGFVAIIVGLLIDRKSTRLNSSHIQKSRMPSSA